MDDADEIPVMAPVNLPSAWTAERKLSEAMQFLATNRDLLDDEDIALALASEQPDALKLLDAFACAAQQAGDHAEVIRGRMKVLQKRALALELKETKLRDQLAAMLPALKLKRHRTPVGTVTLLQTQGRVVITDESLLPEKYIHTETVRHPRRQLIADDISAGIDVPGAYKSNGVPSVQIR